MNYVAVKETNRRYFVASPEMVSISTWKKTVENFFLLCFRKDRIFFKKKKYILSEMLF